MVKALERNLAMNRTTFNKISDLIGSACLLEVNAKFNLEDFAAKVTKIEGLLESLADKSAPMTEPQSALMSEMTDIIRDIDSEREFVTSRMDKTGTHMISLELVMNKLEAEMAR